MVGTPVNEPSADELLAAVNIAVLPQDLEAALAAADDIQVNAATPTDNKSAKEQLAALILSDACNAGSIDIMLTTLPKEHLAYWYATAFALANENGKWTLAASLQLKFKDKIKIALTDPNALEHAWNNLNVEDRHSLLELADHAFGALPGKLGTKLTDPIPCLVTPMAKQAMESIKSIWFGLDQEQRVVLGDELMQMIGELLHELHIVPAANRNPEPQQINDTFHMLRLYLNNCGDRLPAGSNFANNLRHSLPYLDQGALFELDEAIRDKAGLTLRPMGATAKPVSDAALQALSC